METITTAGHGKGYKGTSAGGAAGPLVREEHGEGPGAISAGWPRRWPVGSVRARRCSRSRPGRATWRSSWRGWAVSGSSGWTSADRSSHGRRERPRGRACRSTSVTATPPRCRSIADAFDLLVCRAAFKNFSEPVKRPRRDEPGAQARRRRPDHRPARRRPARGDRCLCRAMGLGRFDAFSTRMTLKWLLRWAHTPDRFRALAAASRFGGCEIVEDSIGMEVRLAKSE